MKVKIILALVWTSFSFCERQPRSTVLTDESKRILEHFDFSNFDKQEALNYIDRQRYENQIRGKRNHCKLKRHQNVRNEDVSEKELNSKELTKTEENNKALNCDLKFVDTKENYRGPFINNIHSQEPIDCDCSSRHLLKIDTAGIRAKRGHLSKKKNKLKSQTLEYEKEDKKQRKKKKKKKKRHYWGLWSEWSPCSVTCGRGRKIRWRKCIAKNCKTGELEMGEKTCQLPACNLFTKLLGL